MSYIEKINKLLQNKYGNIEKSENLIYFYNRIKKFGLNPVKEIYPRQLFDNNLELLLEVGILDNIPGQHDITENLSNKDFKRFDTLNIDWLRYYVIFAEIGNTKDAALHLNISTQALLKAISGIEAHYNVKLVERNKHFRGLTITGQLFLEKARLLLQDLNNLDKYFSNIKKPFNEIVKIGFSNLWIDQVMPNLIDNYIKKFPEVYPKLYSMSGSEVEKWILAGEIDIGLVGEVPVNPELIYIELEKSPYIIVGKPQYKKHFRQLSYIIPSSLSINNDIFLNTWFKEHFFDCKVVLNVNNLQMALNLCEQGIGACWVPEMAVCDRIKKGSLEIIADSPTDFHAHPAIVWNKRIELNQLMSELIKEIVNSLKK